MKITTNDENNAVNSFLEKKESLSKKAIIMKSENNSKKMRYNDKRAINDLTLDALYDKVIYSLKSVSSVMENNDSLITINILSLLFDFAYIDLKFSDKQLTSLLLYTLRRNLDGDKILFVDKCYANLHKVVKESYFDKQDEEGNLIDFNYEDVSLIKTALKDIDVHKKVKTKIIKTLEEMAVKVEVFPETVNEPKKKYKKAEKKDVINFESLTKMFEKKEEEKPILSKKEYYMINNELLEYFSFDDKKTSVQEINNSIMLDKPLCNSERNRCVELLSRAKYEISTIKTFLEKAYSYNKYCMNPLAFYNDIYDLLKELIKNNYDEYYYLEVYIEDINKLILEMNMANKRDYCLKLELIKNMLDEILDMLPQEKINSYYLVKAKKHIK